ncbi:hypothetical protein chiPu_0021305 [Chiloscyllium punctatum]|uniref:Uncharacterized protein n=1 Tax=Chiloscyllium punctatum TaxID=137246 RepID=A0A401RQ00_CHIPU|nr:hypothetical protein [Chiloscyllium punctatum]
MSSEWAGQQRRYPIVKTGRRARQSLDTSQEETRLSHKAPSSSTGPEETIRKAHCPADEENSVSVIRRGCFRIHGEREIGS